MAFIPYAVSWNLTRRCNLACQHCYIDAVQREKGDNELTTDQALDVVSRVAEVNPGAVLILTGGEPLARGDIHEICKKASSLGLMVVLGTNGTLLTPETAKKLRESGVSGVGISIDSLQAERHDSFRGSPGSLKKAMDGLIAARDAGIEIQVQTTPTRENIDELPMIAEWAHRIGAKVFNIFFLVCTGRGQTMADITPDQYEKVLKWAAESQQSFPGMMIRPKCAPHFKRILFQNDKNHPLLNTYIAACRAGTHYCRITPDGKVTPCPYMDIEAGNLLKTDFKTVWNASPELAKYRTPEYGGKCGICAYRLLCGGCRARAYATLGDEMAEDQWCVYEPLAPEEAIANLDTAAKFADASSPGTGDERWTDEAKSKLAKMPVFARSIVEMAVNRYADEHGIKEITPEVMRTAAPPPGQFAPQPTAAGKPAEGKSDIPWDEDARARVENSPDFVRPGILKLMQKRAKERGKERITSELLTEIRNESMMLVTRRMKKLGVQELGMGAWDLAKDKFKKSEHKREVIEKIVGHLEDREKPNEMILEKFASYFEDTSETMGWTKEARQRIERAPVFVRGKAKELIEKYAKEHGYRYVTETAVDEAMANSPFGRFAKPGSR